MRSRRSYGAPVAAMGHRLYNFTSGSLPPGATLTRASTGWYFDSAGALQSAANDVPRFTYDPTTLALQGLLDEPARTNSIRNNTGVGASAPSTLPTNWSVPQASGLTTAVVGTNSNSGIDYTEVHISGTPSGTNYRLAFDASGAIAALTGQAWALSTFVAITAGGLTNISAIRLAMVERNSGGGPVVFPVGSDFKSNLGTAFFRGTFLTTLSGGATVASVVPEFSLVLTIGQAVDITLRVGLPQMEQGSGASSPIKTSSAAVARAADVLSLAMTDGTYDIDITRLSGVTNVTGAVVSGGAYTVPTDLSPLQSVVARKVA